VLTIPQVVRAAAEFGDREALVHDGRRWTYTAFVTEIERCARAFMASGLNPGDRVAVWAPNSAEWMFAALGAQMVGGVLVPINTRFKGSEAAYVIERSGASFLFVSNGFLGIDYSDSLPELPKIRRVIDFASSSWSEFISLGASVESTEVSRRADAVRPDDLSDIIFTSGTTGRPKGVMSRHDQTIRVFLEWSGVIGLNGSDRYLIVNPFFHTFGYKAGFLACVLRGATMLPVATFDVSSVLRTIDAERITALPGPPTLYLSILDHPDRTKHDLGRVGVEDDSSDARGIVVPSGAHRVRTHRVDRNGHDVPHRRRSRDHFVHQRSGHRRCRGSCCRREQRRGASWVGG
jgi:acyl-CoA synthetase (AMP-forming)/AMP-acid ligase II